MKYCLTSFFLFIWSLYSFSSTHVNYFNKRFVWIEVPSHSVKARLNLPVDGYSVCWVEVKTSKERFDFIFRRGLPFNTCLHYILSIRKLLKKNETVQIIGNAGSREKIGDYFSMFELIRGKTGCVGYFSDCENFEKEDIDWPLWKYKPIDPKLYP